MTTADVERGAVNRRPCWVCGLAAVCGKSCPAGDSLTLLQILAEMRRVGIRYTESTIRTHVTSRMCADAPALTARLGTTSSGSEAVAAGLRTPNR